jgi:hypothetical protein
MPRGVTTIELAVTMAITAVIFSILGAIFIAQGRYFAIEDAIGQTQYNAFQIVDTVGLYAHSASATINGTVYASGTSTLVLEMPSVDADGEIIPATYDYVAFGVSASDPTRFILDIDAGTNSDRINGTRQPASLVDKLIFRYNTVDPTEATAVELYVRTSKDVRGQTVLMPLGKIYYLGAS